jgi:hypothetical protein
MIPYSAESTAGEFHWYSKCIPAAAIGTRICHSPVSSDKGAGKSSMPQAGSNFSLILSLVSPQSQVFQATKSDRKTTFPPFFHRPQKDYPHSTDKPFPQHFWMWTAAEKPI